MATNRGSLDRRLFVAAGIAPLMATEAYRYYRLPGPYAKHAEKVVLDATVKLARPKRH